MNYLLIGPEEYLKEQFLTRLKKTLLNNTDSKLNFEIFYGDETDVQEALNSSRTLPFISQHKIIVLKSIHKFLQKEKEAILKYLKSPSSSTTLVMETELNNSNKFLEKLSKLAKTIRCNKLWGNELDDWIRKEFTGHKKRVSTETVNIIKESIGNDLSHLKSEIEKIASFAGDAGEITNHHAENVLGESSHKTAFELIELIINDKKDDIIASLDKLLTKDKPHEILSLLAWQLRNFTKIKKMSKNPSAASVSQALNVNLYRAKKAISQSRYFTQSDIEKNLETILNSDFFIKRGKMEARHALEQALLILYTSGKDKKIGN